MNAAGAWVFAVLAVVCVRSGAWGHHVVNIESSSAIRYESVFYFHSHLCDFVSFVEHNLVTATRERHWCVSARPMMLVM